MRFSRRAVLTALAASFAPLGSSCGRARGVSRDGGRVVVDFWYAFGDLVRKVLLDLVAAYNESQSRVLVRPVHQGDYFECLAKLRTAVAAGRAPALSHVVLEVLPYLSRAGAIEPLDAYQAASPVDLVPALAQQGSFEASGEATFGIPLNRSTPIVFTNRTSFDRAGAAIPATWDELALVARHLTGKDADGSARWGFEVPISWWYWVAMVGQAGGRLVRPDGQLSLGGEAGELALRFWQTLVRDGVMRPPPGGDYQAWQSTNESFLRGRVAMTWGSTAFLRYLENNAPFPVVAAPLPRQERASVPTGGTMFVLMRAAAAEEKSAAWDFVRWMCDIEPSIEWSTRTGYMPIARGAVDALSQRGFYANHPNDKVAFDQLTHVDPWPWAPELFRVERDIVEPRLQEAVLTGRDAREVLQEARLEALTPG